MARSAVVTEEATKKISASGISAGAKFSEGIEKGTTRAGSAFEKLGNSLSNWGIPFAGNLSKIGQDLDNVSTHGKGVIEALSAVGGVATAALIGAGVESIHISDQFEIAQANLETAIKNSGNSFSTYKGQIDAAYSSAAKLGFENNDVAAALATLTTATQSPQKALNDLSTAENVARMRHESLSDASSQLAKILGGNTRLLQQWGINLDIGTGKLHSIQSATEAVQKAQLNLNTTQAEINTGQKTGAEATGALKSAQESLRNAQLNLKQDQQAIPSILDAINQRVNGAAKAYGQTLPGEMKIAESEVHNLGVAFGEYLVPKVDQLLGLAGKVIGWLEQNKGAADALGFAIATTLGGAIAIFVGTKVVSFVGGIGKMVTSIESVILKSSAMRSGLIGDDGAIIAENEALSGSFATMATSIVGSLAKVAAPLAALLVAYKLYEGYSNNSGQITGITGTSNVKTAESEFRNSTQGKEGVLSSSAIAQLAAAEVANYDKTHSHAGTTVAARPEGNAGIGGGFGYSGAGTTKKTPTTGGGGGGGTGGAAPSQALTAAEIALELSAVKANEALKLATSTASGGSNTKLAEALTKVHQAGFDKLIAALNATANVQLTKLAATMNSTLAAALTKLADSETLSTYAKANAKEVAAQRTAGQTTAAANAGSAATGLSGLGSQQTADNLNNAATATNDAAKLQADAAQAQVQASQDLINAANDAANAQVAAINDQTQIQVDTLGERGLYGLALQAQLAKVALDTQKQVDDQNVATAQAHLDAVTTQTNATLATAQAAADTAQQQQDALVASAQSKADSVAITSSINTAASQAVADQAALTAAVNNAAAQAHVDAVQFGSQAQQQQAAATQKLVQSQGDAATATANASLQAATNAANSANQNAQNAYSQAQAYAAQQEALAQAALTAAQSSASTQQSLASTQLATIQNAAAIQEAKLTSIVNVDQELVNTQFAGGYQVNVYAQPGDGPQEYANAVGWALRTRPS